MKIILLNGKSQCKITFLSKLLPSSMKLFPPQWFLNILYTNKEFLTVEKKKSL